MSSLAVLCDYGLDDAVATIYLLEHAHLFEKIDILPVGGNFPLKDTFVNAKKLLSNFNYLSNIRIIDTTSIKQKEERLPHIHGNDGMGDILSDNCVFNGTILSFDDWIKSVDDTYTVFSVGPCTVTLEIMKRFPTLPLVMMCGNISEKPNYGLYEFNHGVDPSSFSECVKFDHCSVTLDTAHVPNCDFYINPFNRSELFDTFAKRSMELAKQRGDSGCYIYDLVAAVYLVHPEKFISEFLNDAFGNTVNVLEYIDNKFLI